jgi:hypothetical protein
MSLADMSIAYIIAGAALYFTLQYVTEYRLPNRNLAMYSVIAVLVFAVVQAVYTMLRSKEIDAERCKSYCDTQEHLSNVSSVTYPVPPTTLSQAIVYSENKTDYESYQCAKDKIDKSNVIHNFDYIEGNNLVSRNDDGTYTYTYHGPQQESNVVKYNYHDHNIMPVNVNPNAYETGYSYLPPSQWFKTSPHPPVCISEKRCAVWPMLTSGSNADLKEWNPCR